MTPEDVDFCRGKARVYAVKESYHLAPWADVLYAADADWWARLKGVPDFKGEKWTVSPDAAKYYGLNHIEYRVELPWSNQQGLLATGGNSGFQALNLAVLQGASEVILLGYDMGFAGDKKHWWTGQIKREFRDSNYNSWIKRFHLAVPHIPVPVWNCTRGGYLHAFPRRELKDVL